MGTTSEMKRKREVGDDGLQGASASLIATDGFTNSNAETATEPKQKKQKIKGGEAKQVKSERKSKKALEASQRAQQKRKAKAEPMEVADNLATGEDFVPLDEGKSTRTDSATRSGKPAKEKKSSPRSQRKAAKAVKIAAALEEDAEVVKATAGETPSDSNHRFIVFVGNLPFSATTAQIQAHFQKLAPKSLRHSTDRATGKSRGFCFLEFDAYDRMKTCLELYHQSIFDPSKSAVDGGVVHQTADTEQSQKSRGRRLNVELTAGGGGNTGNRKEKIREKNKKLREERAKRQVEKKEQMQQKLKKRREQAEKDGKKNRRSRGPTGANAEAMNGTGVAREEDGRGDIHPSRMNRVTA